MKIIAIILLLSIFILACEQNKQTTNTSKEQIYSKSQDTGIAVVINKMTNGVDLNNTDIRIISEFLKDDTDNEALSEEIGYCMFQYFKANDQRNIHFLACLDSQPIEEKNRLLSQMIQAMCIDIGEEKLSYKQFITLYKVFQDYPSTKQVFENCVGQE